MGACPVGLLAQAPKGSSPALEDPLLTRLFVAFSETAGLVGVVVGDVIVLFDPMEPADSCGVYDAGPRTRPLGH